MHELVIQIPAGTTEIDLTPILVPIVRVALQKRGSWTEAQTEDAIRDIFEHTAFERRVAKLRQAWICEYLETRGWKAHWRDSDPDIGALVMYEKPKNEPYRRGMNLDETRWGVQAVRDDGNPNARIIRHCQTVRECAQEEKRDKLEILADIEALGSAVDRLADVSQ